MGERTTYRHTLERRWGDGPLLAWVMLNPSVADEVEDDPTIRKVRGFTRGYAGCYPHWSERLAPPEERTVYPRWGGIRVVNLYPMRATDPKALHAASEVDRVGPPAEGALAAVVGDCQSVVVAWGANATRYPERRGAVLALLSRLPLLHLGLTRCGQPRHPLMLAYTTPLLPWAP